MTPWTAPPRGGYSGIGNSKPGTPPQRKKEDRMKQSLKLNITGGVTKEQLAAFVAAIPDGTQANTETTYVEKDRPWESDKIFVALSAEWTI